MMKKSKDSSYSRLYIERNSLEYEKVQNYVKNILKSYGIENYEIKEYQDKGLSLFIYDIERTFIIYTDKNYIELKLLSSDNDFEVPNRGYVKDSCWKQAVREIIKRVSE